jgi:hypothetical protein
MEGRSPAASEVRRSAAAEMWRTAAAHVGRTAAAHVGRSAATDVGRTAATDVGRSTAAGGLIGLRHGACRHGQCAGHQKHDCQFSGQISHGPSSTAPVCAGDPSTAKTGRSSLCRRFLSAVVIEHECFAMLRCAI